MNTEQLKEKLNIQPISKERLKKPTVTKPKQMLKTGDIVMVMKYGSTPTERKEVPYVYIEKDNIRDYVYLENEYQKEKSAEGILLHYEVKWKGSYSYMYLSGFSDNLEPNGIFDNHYITAIYRVNGIGLPLSNEYLLYPPKKNGRLIWKNKSLKVNESVTEKLSIQPISKERLAKEAVPPKERLKTGDVVFAHNIKTKTHQFYVFISKDDYFKYNYEEMLELKILEPDWIRDTGIFVYPKTHDRLMGGFKGITFRYERLVNFNDRLEEIRRDPKGIVIDLIIRNKNIKQPLTVNYFNNPSNEGEKIWFRPYTKEELDALKKCRQTWEQEETIYDF